jgi:hypothetical protein
VGSSPQGSAVRLTYDDFPDRPEVWYFRVKGNTLTVAPTPAELDTDAALVFTRAQQQ